MLLPMTITTIIVLVFPYYDFFSLLLCWLQSRLRFWSSSRILCNGYILFRKSSSNCIYGILKESKPLQYISVILGSIAIIILMSLIIFGGSNSPFIKTFGVGGAERLVAYPVAFWLITLGDIASSLVPSSDITTTTKRGRAKMKRGYIVLISG